jgi:hypothetical protein
MDFISSQIDPSYDNDSIYHRTEEDQDPPPINEDNVNTHKVIGFYKKILILEYSTMYD